MIKRPRVVNGSVTQELDFKEIFGVSFAKATSVREKITQALIDKMKDRIAVGVDINGEEMAPYSEVYKQSVDYIAARKSETVNMTLTGDMLGSIDIIKSEGSKVTIGFISSKESQKAYDHMMGSGKLPVRQFFGITEEEVESVKSEFQDEIKILGDLKSSVITDDNRAANKTLETLRQLISTSQTNKVIGEF